MHSCRVFDKNIHGAQFSICHRCRRFDSIVGLIVFFKFRISFVEKTTWLGQKSHLIFNKLYSIKRSRADFLHPALMRENVIPVNWKWKNESILFKDFASMRSRFFAQFQLLFAFGLNWVEVNKIHIFNALDELEKWCRYGRDRRNWPIVDIIENVSRNWKLIRKL